MKTATCRGCGKPIGFIKTVYGKTIPVDPDAFIYIPGHDGCDTFINADGTTERGWKAPYPAKDTKTGYISHFATCPEADSFRRPRKSDRRRAREAAQYG